ncbi:ABC transporter permease subunit [bacterium]|nr:ABC transporter permease subunit [bacterium]
MFTIIFRFLKDKKLTIASYTLAVILFLWMYIVLFPSIKDSFSELQKMLHAMPEGMLKAFGFEVSTFGTFEGYIGSEQFTAIWPIMIIALCSSFAGNALAAEVEKGTAEVLLSQPISRLRIFFARYISGVLAIFIFIVASIGSIFPLTAIYNITIKSDNFFRLGLLAFVFALAIFSIAIFFSALFYEKGKANFAPAGLLIIMYVINIVSGLKESLQDIKYVSFFYYYNPSKCLVYGQVDNLAWFIFLGSAVVFTFMGAYIFNKKDVSH